MYSEVLQHMVHTGEVLTWHWRRTGSFDGTDDKLGTGPTTMTYLLLSRNFPRGDGTAGDPLGSRPRTIPVRNTNTYLYNASAIENRAIQTTLDRTCRPDTPIHDESYDMVQETSS